MITRILILALCALAVPSVAAHGAVYTYEQLPPAIRQAFEARVGAFDAVDAVHDTEMGHNTFQVTARIGERRHSLIFSFGGDLLVEEIDVAPDALTQATLATLERDQPGARVLSAVRETNFTTDPDHVAHRLTIRRDGLESVVWIDAAGEVENVHVNFATSTPEAASAELRRVRGRIAQPDVH